ncbi:MAG: TlpA disulfide reductase family protein [Pseudomonadota bacterium]
MMAMPRFAHRINSLFLLAVFCLGILPTQVWGVPELRLPDVNGRIHQLSDYRGQWVILNFWATWCPPCLEEIPDLLLFNETFKDQGVVVIGVNFEELRESELLRFIEEQFIDYPILRMKPTLKTPLGRVFGLPTTFIINPRGEVTKIHMGAVTLAELEGYVQLVEGKRSTYTHDE